MCPWRHPLNGIDAVNSTHRWLQAPRSPGVVGYVYAVAVSLVILAVGLALRGLFTSDDQSAAAPEPRGLLVGFVGTVLLVVLMGAIPAAIIGAVGVLVVHVATLGARPRTGPCWLPGPLATRPAGCCSSATGRPRCGG